MPPQYEGQIWYSETHSLLEPLLTGGRLDFIANKVQETVQAVHKEHGWKRRPLVSPKMVLQEAVRSGYISEEEALKHWHWHRREKMRKESLERNISVDLRTEIFRRDGGLCQYCGSRGRTLDHLIPVSKGGLSVRLNLLVACEPCNRKKYTKMPSEETVTVIRFFLKRERTVEHGYPYMSELITQFFEQLATKSHLEQARICGIIGIKRSKVFFQQKKLGIEIKY